MNHSIENVTYINYHKIIYFNNVSRRYEADQSTLEQLNIYSAILEKF